MMRFLLEYAPLIAQAAMAMGIAFFSGSMP
jgi:hypothetical protein